MGEEAHTNEVWSRLEKEDKLEIEELLSKRDLVKQLSLKPRSLKEDGDRQEIVNA
jgi:hypothetical protein